MTFPKVLNESIAMWHRQAIESLRSGPQFVREHRDGFLVLRHRSPEAEEVVSNLMADPDLAYTGATILKPGSRSHIGIVQIAGKSYVLKRYNFRGINYRLLNTMRRSRALRTWLVGWEYLVRGLSIPRPLICLEERRMLMLRRSYVLMELVENAETLREVWDKADPQVRARLVELFGLFLGRMHRTGMIHGDLKWDNIMVGAEAGEYVVNLVDLDGSRALKRHSISAARDDLERFLEDLAKEGGGEGAREKLLSFWQQSFLSGEK